MKVAMNWSYYPKAPKHWDSVLPHGYFIVVEKNDDGDNEYVAYEGDYDDWRLFNKPGPTRIGAYDTLDRAKKAAEVHDAAKP